jgi:hypothetical protein
MEMPCPGKAEVGHADRAENLERALIRRASQILLGYPWNPNYVDHVTHQSHVLDALWQP